ncbi:MAG: M23 family metallopeptidase, partial [Clostridia bacterium]|nr:M23 family metallopeptidase [Clostridia bacterium]
VTSAYGFRRDPFTGEQTFHRGIDISAQEGTPVLAAYGGTVTQSDYDPTGGNYVVLSHRDGTQSYYGHLKTRFVARGDRVEKGETLGLSGATGTVTGAHLHFQLTKGNQTYDPLRFLNPET